MISDKNSLGSQNKSGNGKSFSSASKLIGSDVSSKDRSRSSLLNQPPPKNVRADLSNSKPVPDDDEGSYHKHMSEIDILEGSFNVHSKSSASIDQRIQASDNQKRGKTINQPAKELRMFQDDQSDEGSVIMDERKQPQGKPSKSNRKPGASDSEPSQGSAFTMVEEEENDQGMKIKEDFEDFHVKIMALNEQIKDLETEFNSLANAKAIELEGIGKKEEGQMERHKHLYEIKQLVEMERKLSKLELEKIKLIQKEARVTANLAKFARIYGA